MLIHAEVERFWRDGFIVVDDVLSSDEVEALREAAESDAVRGGLEASGYRERVVHLLEITAKHAAFKALAADPRIVERVAQLIGPDIQLQHSKLATKPPKVGAGTFAWHQDFAYFPHTNTSLVAVMVMLDDATPENGCMSAVVGSHRLGLLDHTVDGWFRGGCQEPERWSNPATVVPLTPRAGGISIHHCLTLHGSPENVSGKPRRGVVFQYRASDAVQLADNVWVDTGWQVRGNPSSTARCENAVFILPKWRGRNPSYGSVWRQTGSAADEWNAEQAAP